MPDSLSDFETFRVRMNYAILGAGNLTINRFFAAIQTGVVPDVNDAVARRAPAALPLAVVTLDQESGLLADVEPDPPVGERLDPGEGPAVGGLVAVADQEGPAG